MSFGILFRKHFLEPMIAMNKIKHLEYNIIKRDYQKLKAEIRVHPGNFSNEIIHQYIKC